MRRTWTKIEKRVERIGRGVYNVHSGSGYKPVLWPSVQSECLGSPAHLPKSPTQYIAPFLITTPLLANGRPAFLRCNLCEWRLHLTTGAPGA